MAAERTSRRYIAILAAISGLILIVGSKLKPASVGADGSGNAPISEAEVIRERLQLQRTDQRRALENMTSYFAEAATTAAERIVAMPGVGSALVWDESGLLVAPRISTVPQRPGLVLPGGEQANAELVAAAPDLPIAGYRMGGPGSTPLRRVKTLSYEFVQSGEWLVAVARAPDGKHIFAPGNYSGTGPARCPGLNYRALLTTIPLNHAMLGGGLFDPDGNLIAMVVECAGEFVAVVTEDIASAVERAASLESRVLEHFGFRASPLTQAAVAYFKEKSGLVVDEIWDDSAAAENGLAVGDVIVSVGELRVDLPEDLQVLFPSDGVKRRELVVRRNSRQIPISLNPAEGSGKGSESPAAAIGVRVNGPGQGQVIESVAPDSPAARAGLQSGDRILRVDDNAMTNLAVLQRALSAAKSKPVFIVYKRHSRTQGSLIG
jgi:S1-C subfamily serine protease